MPVGDIGKFQSVLSLKRRLHLLHMKVYFSLMSCPSVSCHFPEVDAEILSGLRSYCNVYIDDISILSSNFDEHRLQL